MEPELELPRDIDLRLLNVYTGDIDRRVKELSNLVALQESELALLWFTLAALFAYIVVKEHRGQVSRTN